MPEADISGTYTFPSGTYAQGYKNPIVMTDDRQNIFSVVDNNVTTEIYRSSDAGATFSSFYNAGARINLWMDTDDRLHAFRAPDGNPSSYLRWDPPNYALAINEGTGVTTFNTFTNVIFANTLGQVYIFYINYAWPQVLRYIVRNGTWSGATDEISLTGVDRLLFDVVITPNNTIFIAHQTISSGSLPVTELQLRQLGQASSNIATSGFLYYFYLTHNVNNWQVYFSGSLSYGTGNIWISQSGSNETLLFNTGLVSRPIRGATHYPNNNINIYYGASGETMRSRIYNQSAIASEVVATANTVYNWGDPAVAQFQPMQPYYPLRLLRNSTGLAGMYHRPMGGADNRQTWFEVLSPWSETVGGDTISHDVLSYLAEWGMLEIGQYLPQQPEQRTK